ncbi:MAG: VanW family protein [Lachnospiraceae bacterium]|nr:VanW family protein [Lachnospiraceae bacterium]
MWRVAALVAVILLTMTAGAGICVMQASAAANDGTIKTGIYIDNIDISGLTAVDAKAKVEEYVNALKETPVVLEATDGDTITVTAGELGLSWANSEVIDEAATIGTEGNLIQRYKALKDLEHESKVFPLELVADKEAMVAFITEKSEPYNVEAINASLKKVEGQFVVEGGQTGVRVDAEASAELLYQYLLTEWDRVSDVSVGLEIVIEQPQGTEEELLQVKDVLGSFTTNYRTSGKSRSANVSNGCALINGTTLYPGEEFSTYEAVSPFSEANGYYPAGSYLNGMVVDSLGGGICQVSTTLYNAVLLAELDVTERHNHSMIVTYVDPSADAAIAESSGKDFRFVNNTEYPIYIEGITENRNITFTIYGVETRNADRTVTYESETLAVIQPDSERIIATTSQPVGYVDIQSAHIGYKAKLWKVVTENGVEVSRTEVNSSNYAVSPRTATVGIATADPNVLASMQAAIATGSIDYVSAIASTFVVPVVPVAPDAAPAAAPAMVMESPEI